MSGSKFAKAIKSVVAVCKASEMAGNISVTVDVRYTQDDKPVVVVIVYNSKKDNMTHIKTFWKTLKTELPPESLCFEAI